MDRKGRQDVRVERREMRKSTGRIRWNNLKEKLKKRINSGEKTII